MTTHTWTCPDCDVAWCPGCGNHGILKLVGETLAELELDPRETVFVSGIGQAAKLPQYVNAHHFNGLHGRALPAATAIRASNPGLTVVAESGDGDMYGEGGNHFLRTFAARTGDEARTFTPAALEIIMAYPFPGNIRELRNVVEYCVNICPQGEMGVEHLPRTLLARALQPSAIETEPAREVATAPTAEIGGRDWLAIERELIVNTLTSTRGNRSRAAGILGWGRTTLWRKLKLHGLAPEAGDKGGQA